MARAAFARSELLVMDDCFSGLDANTEDIVFDNLLSKEGILRKANMTIVLASSDCKYIALFFHFSIRILSASRMYLIRIRLLTPLNRSSCPICGSNYLAE